MLGKKLSQEIFCVNFIFFFLNFILEFASIGKSSFLWTD